jgi:hypothetical protein
LQPIRGVFANIRTALGRLADRTQTS